MKLSDFKTILPSLETISFKTPSGEFVPKYFHITEIGHINKRFIDCGGTVRHEDFVTFQLWEGPDIWHKLEPSKLLDIIILFEKQFGANDHEIEIEYQGETINKYGLSFEDKVFVLSSKKTACLAQDACGIPAVNKIISNVESCCTPGSGCC